MRKAQKEAQRLIGRTLRSASTLGAVLLVSTLSARAQVLDARAGTNDLVLEYGHLHSMLAEQDTTPLLRIYGDGRVLVHYPVYMQRAGDYELRLPAEEVESLIAELEAEGLASLDVARGLERRQEKVELQQSRGELFHVSDTTQTVLRFRVNPSGAVRAGGSSKTVRWNNVQTDAKRFPELDTVQAIARCEERLQELLERDDLTRLP